MPFPFLRLPGEIRNRIYTHSLCPDKEVMILPNKASPDPLIARLSPTILQSPAHRLALLLTNRQISKEATPYFFAENTFRFFTNFDSAIEDVLDATNTFLDGLSSERRNLIGGIRLDLTFGGFMALQEGDFQDFAKVLGTAERLRRLEVNMVTDVCRCRPSAQISGHVESLLEALGTGVSAVVTLECSKSLIGSGIGGWLVDHKILGFRCGGHDRTDDCDPKGRTLE